MIRNFASLNHNGMEHVGDQVTIANPNTAQKLQEKGLILPAYSTKEDKKAARVQKKPVTLKHDKGGVFFVMRGDTIIDRLTKKKAQKLADELNHT